MLGLLVWMRRRLGGLAGIPILRGLLQAGIASAAMAAVLLIGPGRFSAQPAWLTLSLGVIVGGGIYGLVCLLLGVSEIRGLISWLVRRLRG